MPAIQPIPVRSEEIQEIMERTPGWMMRWGISLFLGLILILLLVSWFIAYPDVINTSITITSERPPVSLVAEASGKLRKLFIKDRQLVDSNQVLALIENPADYMHVQALKELVKDSSGTISHFPALQLGEIQLSYSVYKQAMETFLTFKEVALYDHKLRALRLQQSSQNLLHTRILQQFQTLTEDYALARIKCQADSSLCANGVIPRLEYNTSQATLLQKKYAWQGANTTLAQTEVQINELNKTATELKIQFETEEAKYGSELSKALEQLKAAIKTWEQKYVITSPARGTVNLFNYWSENAPVKQGDVIMIVTPEHPGPVIGRINLPGLGSAKVKEGQAVNIKLLNYPYEEFGMLPGRVASVSLLPKDSMYAVRISFPEGMRSSYNKQLEFRQQMIGTAEIITEKRRLLGRMLNKVKIKF